MKVLMNVMLVNLWRISAVKRLVHDKTKKLVNPLVIREILFFDDFIIWNIAVSVSRFVRMGSHFTVIL